MKKIAIILLSVLVCAVAAGAVFIATFNADRYRPLIVQKASEALGLPVDLGRVSLVWQNGLALRFEKLVVYADAQKRSRAAEVGEAAAVVKLKPLLHKQIQVSSILVKDPIVRLVKGTDGQVRLKGMSGLPPAPASAPSAKQGGPAAAELSIGSLKIVNATVSFDDETVSPPAHLEIGHIDVDVKEFSPDKPFPIVARAALFASVPNVRVSGTVDLPRENSAGSVSGVTLRSDLSSVDLKELAETVPSMRGAGLLEIRGQVDASVTRLELGPNALRNLKSEFRLTDGRVRTSSMRGALDKVEISAVTGSGDFHLKDFSAEFAGGTLKATGIVKDFQGQALSGFHWTSSGLAIEELGPQTRGGPQMTGRLTLDFEGQARGVNASEISQTLSGQGRVLLKDGVLLNFNLLREVVHKISVVPGAENMLQTHLPDLYQAKMAEPHTAFAPVDLPVLIQNGQMMFDRLHLETDHLAVDGAGQMGFDKTISARAAVRLDSRLSNEIVTAVPQTQMLLGGGGQIEVPVQIQGRLPSILVVPDPDYIAQKVLAVGAQRIMTNLLDKPAEAGQAGVKNSVAGLLGSKEGLKNLFKQAISGEGTNS